MGNRVYVKQVAKDNIKSKINDFLINEVKLNEGTSCLEDLLNTYKISKRNQEVFLLYYHNLSLSQLNIAEQYKLSRERIRCILYQTIKKIDRYQKKKMLNRTEFYQKLKSIDSFLF